MILRKHPGEIKRLGEIGEFYGAARSCSSLSDWGQAISAGLWRSLPNECEAAPCKGGLLEGDRRWLLPALPNP